MADKLIIDCADQREAVKPLTAAEETDRQALAAETEAQRQATATATTNRTAIEDKLMAALATNRTYKQRPNSEKTAAVVRDHVDALNDQMIALIRHTLRSFDATT